MSLGRATSPGPWTTYVGWPVYLACSWAWCIGMYLPILLREMYGWSAVLAFAIPNVVGVSLFGFAITSAAQSRGLVAAHHRAMAWFSILTIAFHAYFLTIIWSLESVGSLWVGILLALLVLALSYAARILSDRALRRVAMVLYAFVLVLLIALLAGMDATRDWLTHTDRVGAWPVRGAGHGIFFAPIFAIGLLLCPYFDLTFHRAYQATARRGGPIPFMIFGALFAIVLLLTAVYWSTGLVWAVKLHILVQAWFTMTVHFRELDRVRSSVAFPIGQRVPLFIALVAIVLALVPGIDYRWWFLYTGLVFPAIAILTEVRRRMGLHAAHTLSIALLVVLLTPFCFAAFVLDTEWLAIVPAIALTLTAFMGVPETILDADQRDESAPLPTG